MISRKRTSDGQIGVEPALPDRCMSIPCEEYTICQNLNQFHILGLRVSATVRSPQDHWILAFAGQTRLWLVAIFWTAALYYNEALVLPLPRLRERERSQTCMGSGRFVVVLEGVRKGRNQCLRCHSREGGTPGGPRFFWSPACAGGDVETVSFETLLGRLLPGSRHPSSPAPGASGKNVLSSPKRLLY